MSIHIYHQQSSSQNNHYEFLATILSQFSSVKIKEKDIIRIHGQKPTCAMLPTCFNLSHTKNHVVIAISPDEVGIDAEMTQRTISPLLTHRIKSPNEQPSHACSLGYWVMKEAAVKFTGGGFAHMRHCSLDQSSLSNGWIRFTDNKSSTQGYVCLMKHHDILWAIASPKPQSLIICDTLKSSQMYFSPDSSDKNTPIK